MGGQRHGAITLAGLCGAWLGGTGLQLLQPEVLTPAGAGALLVAAFALAGAAWALARPLPGGARPGARALAGLLALSAAALAAYALADARAQARLAARLPASLEGADLVVTGTVAELPRVSVQGTRFVFAVESARRAGPRGEVGLPVPVPPRLSLAWYQGFDGEALLSRPSQPLVAGDRWRLTVRLRQPHGPLNPHGFDLERWLFEQDLLANGTVRPGAQRLDTGWAHPAERLRQHIRDAILLRIDDPRAAGVVAALAVGDQASIAREDWELFRVTGVAHLMSISGLHVTMFAWLAAGLVGAAWRRSGRLALACPAPVAARWGGLALAFGYALLAGFGVPAQRTVLMLAVVVALRAQAVRWPAVLVLLAAAVAVTLLEPWALVQPGFWLSFAAVGLLMLSTPATDAASPAGAGLAARAGAALRSGLRTQAVASIGLAPLTLLFFQQVSLAGFAANLFAIPWVTLVVTPLSLLGIALPPLWALAGGAVQALVPPLQALAELPLAQWTAAAAPAWALAAGLAGGALLVLPLPWRLRLAGLPLLLPLLWPPVPRPPEGGFEVVAVDVGQGTAVLVRTRQHLLVYDAGPRTLADTDAGERIVLPLLRARGERAVDLLVLSHRDADHVGGAESLLRGLPVRALSSSLEPGHRLAGLFASLPKAGAGSSATPVSPARCAAGQRWSWDGVAFEVLHPRAEDYGPAGAAAGTGRPNALSCVLQATSAEGRSLLLTGDIEAAQEQALLERAGARLRSEVLLVPHHGSLTSSTPAFVEAVAPRVAVVQAGYRSRFGHPAPEVVARYEARGVALVRSDRCGGWSWSTATGEGRCERDQRRRYWHAHWAD
jgi:competence protein ComEC